MMTYSEFKAQMNTRDLCKITDEYNRYFHREVTVGDGATLCLWTDRHAYDVIRVTPRTLVLRRCKVIPDPNWAPQFVVGGFCAHCTNQGSQEWNYEPDPDGDVIRAVWSEKKGRYMHHGATVIAGRHEFYDYNF